MERRLAAIPATDVVGYSRLMERDEAATLAALKAHRKELIEPKVAEHHGRIVKLMGDGALIEFASVVDAVACAAAIQRAMAARNEHEPEERCMAAMIPGARFVTLEGRNHLILENEPAWPRFLREVESFLAGDD